MKTSLYLTIILLGLSVLSSCEKIGGGNNTISIGLSQTSLSLEQDCIAVLNVICNPSDTTGMAITWSSSNTGVATVSDGMVTSEGVVVGVNQGETEIIAKCGKATAKCVVTVNNPVLEGAVDMGLSVYWASRNVCDTGFTNSPEEAGDFYAWGETKTKDQFSLYNYKWYYYPRFHKYTLSDKRTKLDVNDDVAKMVLGGAWRIPTEGEWRELIENCSQKWTRINGINGLLVISNKNGNSIFLPAAGHKRSASEPVYYGSSGEYWSNNLSETDLLNAAVRHAAIGHFFEGLFFRIDEEAREFGCTVRPVSQ